MNRSHNIFHLSIIRQPQCFDGPTLRKEVGEHLARILQNILKYCKLFTCLDGVQRSTCTFRMELHPPHFPSRICCRLDTLDGRIIAIYEKGFPTSRERILKFQSILVILTRVVDGLQNGPYDNQDYSLPSDIDSPSSYRSGRGQR
jgi:hypothetical protein